MNKKLSSTKTQQETNGMVGSWQWREAGGGEKLAAERSWRRREAGGVQSASEGGEMAMLPLAAHPPLVNGRGDFRIK